MDAHETSTLPHYLKACQDAYSTVKKATYEWARACQVAQSNGRSLREIAEASGNAGGKDTVSRAIKAVSQCDNADDFDARYQAVVKATNGSKPKPAPRPEGEPPAAQDDNRPEAEPAKVGDVTEHVRALSGASERQLRAACSPRGASPGCRASSRTRRTGSGCSGRAA
jgi:hypothetical protein